MALVEKLEAQLSIKSSADRFFDTYPKNQDMLSEMCPNIVKDIHAIKGDFESVGSLIKWTYAPVGNSSPEVGTVVTEIIDEENKSTTFRLLDGNLTKLYSVFKFTVQVTDSPDGNGSLVKSSVEYKKLNASVPEPTKYFDSAQIIFKSIDDDLVDNP